MRRADWLERLQDEVAAAESRPFEWGQHDCCLFAARCVDAMTERGIAAELQAEYTDKPSALRYIARHGDLKSAITAKLGDPLPWWKLSRGDLCLVDSDDGLGSLGVCMGVTVACVSTDVGLTHVPIDRTTAGWAV